MDTGSIIWTRNDWIFPISRDYAFDMIIAMRKTMEEVFGTSFNCEITFREKLDTDATHTSREVKTSDFNDISRARWKKMYSVQASLRPVDKSKAPAATWASIEIEGYKAKFYVQPFRWEIERMAHPSKVFPDSRVAFG